MAPWTRAGRRREHLERYAHDVIVRGLFVATSASGADLTTTWLVAIQFGLEVQAAEPTIADELLDVLGGPPKLAAVIGSQLDEELTTVLVSMGVPEAANPPLVLDTLTWPVTTMSNPAADVVVLVGFQVGLSLNRYNASSAASSALREAVGPPLVEPVVADLRAIAATR
jgi:hypothetical protein